jgi:hypothetical protein
MPTRKAAADGSIYQLKVTLRGSRPPIWRRLQASGTTSLEKLHWIIQTAFGWTNSHLHQFIVDRQTYSLPEFELDEFGDEIKNERRAKLGQLGLGPKSKFVYEYDFGDDWDHEIIVEKVLEKEAGVAYPRCTGGKRAGPPEDCGGVWGYERLQEVIKDPKDDEYESMMEWLGGGFDPEHFDLEEINEQLKGIK